MQLVTIKGNEFNLSDEQIEKLHDLPEEEFEIVLTLIDDQFLEDYDFGFISNILKKVSKITQETIVLIEDFTMDDGITYATNPKNSNLQIAKLTFKNGNLTYQRAIDYVFEN